MRMPGMIFLGHWWTMMMMMMVVVVVVVVVHDSIYLTIQLADKARALEQAKQKSTIGLRRWQR
jgi:uncharacterized membrane protein